MFSPEACDICSQWVDTVLQDPSLSTSSSHALLKARWSSTGGACTYQGFTCSEDEQLASALYVSLQRNSATDHLRSVVPPLAFALGIMTS